MSLIFDAIKRSEALRGEAFEFEEPMLQPRKNRDSLRWQLNSAVFIYGHAPACTPFYIEAHIVNVSKRGALLLLDVPLIEGDDLLLINEAIEDPQACRVVHTRALDSTSFQIGVEFPSQNPEFWEHFLMEKSLAQ